MPRQKHQRDQESNRNEFSFVRLSADKSYIERISAGISSDSPITTDDILAVTDRGWKLSISQHATHGYYIATITDKLKRKGCGNRAFLLEHNDIEVAIKAAIYSACELLDEGYRDDDAPSRDLDW